MESPFSSQSDEVKRMELAESESVISKLAKENGWLSSDDYPLYLYQGFWYYKFYIQGILALKTQRFIPSSSNILISSTPKSGTTWLKALSFAIVTRTRFTINQNSFENHPLLNSISHDLVPMIEAHIAQNYQPIDSNLPLFATHLPFPALPSSVLASGCKIVYICRDPKDAFVSRWHFAHKLSQNKEVNEPIPLEQAFDLFCRGISPLGPYWDHVLGYWKASLDFPDRTLFLKYEDMMDDPVFYVKRLAEFMGYGFSDVEEKEKLGERIVDLCSFEKLSNLDVSKNGVSRPKGFVSMSHDSFFRKGKVGDWKNYLTEEMAHKIDQITFEKHGTSGLRF